MRNFYLLFFFLINVAYSQKTVKFASLAPKSSTWGNCLHNIAKDVWVQSDQTIRIRVYYGGKMGDEAEIAEKIKYRALDGGAFTGNGIGHVCPEARVLDLPGLFDSSGQIDYVYKNVRPVLNKYFNRHGYELISLAETGFAYFFSKHDIRSIADVRKTKMWLWKGDPVVEAFMDVLEIPAKPVNFTEVIPSLQTGVIDGVYVSPTPGLQLQWYQEMNYMLDLKLVNVSGGVVMSLESWNDFSEEEKQMIRRITVKYVHELIKQNRAADQRTLKLFQNEGLVINASEDPEGLMKETGLIMKEKLDGKLFPASLSSLLFDLAKEYKETGGEAPSQVLENYLVKHPLDKGSSHTGQNQVVPGHDGGRFSEKRSQKASEKEGNNEVREIQTVKEDVKKKQVNTKRNGEMKQEKSGHPGYADHAQILSAYAALAQNAGGESQSSNQLRDFHWLFLIIILFLCAILLILTMILIFLFFFIKKEIAEKKKLSESAKQPAMPEGISVNGVSENKLPGRTPEDRQGWSFFRYKSLKKIPHRLYHVTFKGGIVFFFSAAVVLYLLNFFLTDSRIYPLVQYLFVVAGLMGAAYAVKYNENIKIELLRKMASKRIVIVVRNVTSALITVLILWVFYRHFMTELRDSFSKSSLGIPSWVLDVPYLYLFAVSLYYYLNQAYCALNNRFVNKDEV